MQVSTTPLPRKPWGCHGVHPTETPPACCHVASKAPTVPSLFPQSPAKLQSPAWEIPRHRREFLAQPTAGSRGRAPLTNEAPSGLAVPVTMAEGPLPSSDALLLLLLFPSLQPLLQKKTLTSTRGEQSQLGNRGSTLSYRFWWLCCFSTKNKKSGRVEKFKTGRKMLLFSPARCLAENKQPGWGQRGLAASQAGGSRQLDARKQTRQRKAPSDPPAGVPSAYVLRAELKCFYTFPRADPLAQSEDSPLKLGPVWAGDTGSASSVKAALKGLIWISRRNRGRGGAGVWLAVGGVGV